MSDLTDPKQWEDAEFDWDPKTLYSISMNVFFGKPSKLFENVQQLRAEIDSKGYVIKPEAMLLMEVDLFKGKLHIEIEKPREYDANVSTLEKSKLFTAVHNGPMKTIKNTAKALKSKVEAAKGVSPTATYYWDFRHGPELAGQRADRFVVLCRV